MSLLEALRSVWPSGYGLVLRQQVPSHIAPTLTGGNRDVIPRLPVSCRGGQALDLYRLEKGKYPSNEEGLKALEPYLKKELPKDPWGNEFHYKFPGDHGEYELVSYGADNAEGGEDNDLDIVSWKNLEKK